MEPQHLIHTVDPVYDSHSRVLILGTFPSPKSREMGFFYGHPQNRMWKVLAAVMRQDEVPQGAADRRAFLLRNRIAMWDTVATCTITGASDASIRDVVPNDLSRIFAVADIGPGRVFTTGAKATQLYRRYQLSSTGIEPTRLPSTSAANASWSLERLVEAYRVVRASRDTGFAQT